MCPDPVSLEREAQGSNVFVLDFVVVNLAHIFSKWCLCSGFGRNRKNQVGNVNEPARTRLVVYGSEIGRENATRKWV